MNIWSLPEFYGASYDHDRYAASFTPTEGQQARAVEIVNDALFPIETLIKQLEQRMPASMTEYSLVAAGQDNLDQVTVQIRRPSSVNEGWMARQPEGSYWIHLTGHVDGGKLVFFGYDPSTPDHLQYALETSKNMAEIYPLDAVLSRRRACELRRILAFCQ